MKIRKYEPKDREYVVKICLEGSDIAKSDDPITKYVYEMFCSYYLDNEPDMCFVATDDNDIPFGYTYGAIDFDRYYAGMKPYLKRIERINDGEFVEEAHVEMRDHEIYKDKYSAHLHIDVFEGYRSNGAGSKLIEAMCDNIKKRGVDGVMLIVGADNLDGHRFYEKNGFTLLHEKDSGFAYGKKL